MKFIKAPLITNIYLLCTLVLTFSVRAEVNPELLRSSVVVVAQPEFSLSKIQSFSWAEQHADISAGFIKSGLSVSAIIDTAITQALGKKAYPLGLSHKNSMLIKYHVSLASETNESELTLKYGLSPGLRGNSSEAKAHEQGVLVVELIGPELNKVVWRGAVEVFTGVESTDEGRQNRVNKLLLELFSSFPAREKTK